MIPLRTPSPHHSSTEEDSETDRISNGLFGEEDSDDEDTPPADEEPDEEFFVRRPGEDDSDFEIRTRLRRISRELTARNLVGIRTSTGDFFYRPRNWHSTSNIEDARVLFHLIGGQIVPLTPADITAYGERRRLHEERRARDQRDHDAAVARLINYPNNTSGDNQPLPYVQPVLLPTPQEQRHPEVQVLMSARQEVFNTWDLSLSAFGHHPNVNVRVHRLPSGTIDYERILFSDEILLLGYWRYSRSTFTPGLSEQRALDELSDCITARYGPRITTEELSGFIAWVMSITDRSWDRIIRRSQSRRQRHSGTRRGERDPVSRSIDVDNGLNDPAEETADDNDNTAEWQIDA